MKKHSFKKLLSILLTVIMLLSVVPLGGIMGFDLLSTEAAAADFCNVGDIIELGSYPQSRDKDMEYKLAVIIYDKKLPDYTSDYIIDNEGYPTLNWISYGYYSGDGNIGSMVQGDWMQYADFTIDGVKYRAVRIDENRPVATIGAISDYTRQDANGYVVGHPSYDPNYPYSPFCYVFRFEPLRWRVIDPSKGLLLSDICIDSQAYSNTIYENGYGYDEHGNYCYYTDPQFEHYANDYESSSIRAWLNDDFYNTAFTTAEQDRIGETLLDNNHPHDGRVIYAPTRDKVFLLSYDEAYSFYEYNNSDMQCLTAQSSAYAQAQGCDYEWWEGQTHWLLRTPEPDRYLGSHYCTWDGAVWYSDHEVYRTDYAIRPAMVMPELIHDEFTLTKEVWQSELYQDIPSADYLDYFGATTYYNPESTNQNLGRWQDGATYRIGDSVPFRLTAHVPYDLETNYLQPNTPYSIAIYDRIREGLTFEPTSLSVVAVNGGVETEIPSSAYTLTTSCTYDNLTATADDDVDCAFNLVFDDITEVDGIQGDTDVYVYYNATLNENATMGDFGAVNGGDALLISSYENNSGTLSGTATQWSFAYVYTGVFVVNKVTGPTAFSQQPLEGAGFTLYQLIYDEATDTCHWEELQTIGPEAGRTSFEFRGIPIMGAFKLVETTTPEGYITMEDLEFLYSEDIALERSVYLDFLRYELGLGGVPYDDDAFSAATERFGIEYVETDYPNKEGEYREWVGINATVVNTDGTEPERILNNEVGDIIQFGSYPQSEVTDSALLAELNSQDLSWTSYGYYSGNGSSYSAQQGDWMQYADVEYNDHKYRAVKFTQYKPYEIFGEAVDAKSHQDDNGYLPNNVYWFSYDPLDWRVLDPYAGFVMCETCIDAQAYLNIFNNNYPYNENEFARSSIKEWLNNEFYNLAFTAEEQARINDTAIENWSAKVFLLSENEVKTTGYGFSSSGSSYDSARQTTSSDYAKAQGCYPEVDGNVPWRLRSPGDKTTDTMKVMENGAIESRDFTYECQTGIRPAMRLLEEETPEEPDEPQVTVTSGEVTYEEYSEEFRVAKIEAPIQRENNGEMEYFVYWVDSEDNIIGTYNKYRFLLVKDITVTPIYVPEEDYYTERENGIYASRVVGLRQNADGQTFSLFAEHSVAKSESSITAHGIIYTSNPDCIDQLTINTDNEDVFKKQAGRSTNILTGTLRVGLDRENADYVWARSYIIDSGGNIKYGAVKQFDFNNPDAPPENIEDYEIIDTLSYDMTELNNIEEEPVIEEPVETPTEKPSGNSVFDILTSIWNLILTMIETIFSTIMR